MSTVHENYPDPHHDVYSKTVFGFWVYLLSDFILFGALIATYIVLQHKTFGAAGPKDLFYLPYNLVETFVILTASFTVGLAGAFAHRERKGITLFWLFVTFLLGIFFFIMSQHEFSMIFKQGLSWQTSAFLSAYFTLMGAHQLHVFFGLLWIIVLSVPLIRYGTDSTCIKRITCLRMFWQFLNIVWIFVFTIVYLLGVK